MIDHANYERPALSDLGSLEDLTLARKLKGKIQFVDISFSKAGITIAPGKVGVSCSVSLCGH